VVLTRLALTRRVLVDGDLKMFRGSLARRCWATVRAPSTQGSSRSKPRARRSTACVSFSPAPAIDDQLLSTNRWHRRIPLFSEVNILWCW
jgi:hypothetical protein